MMEDGILLVTPFIIIILHATIAFGALAIISLIPNSHQKIIL